jgi:enamine deaminase RidA (YjgF/YER057c/UK114 family)
MADFIHPSKTFPICDAVVYQGRVMETVLTPIPDGSSQPVPGGAREHTIEIFKQLDEVLSWFGVDKSCVVSVRLYVQNINVNIKSVNEVYQPYFGSHTPMRCAVGVELQAGMLVEAAVTCELPSHATLPKPPHEQPTPNA